MNHTEFELLINSLKEELNKLSTHEYAIQHGVTRQEILAYAVRKLTNEERYPTRQQERHLRLIKNDD